MRRKALTLGIENILATGSPLLFPTQEAAKLFAKIRIEPHKPLSQLPEKYLYAGFTVNQDDFLAVDQMCFTNVRADATGTAGSIAPTLATLADMTRQLEEYARREREREDALCALLMRLAHQQGFALECGDVCVLPDSLRKEGMVVPARLRHCVFLAPVIESIIFIKRDKVQLELPALYPAHRAEQWVPSWWGIDWAAGRRDSER